MSTITRSQFTNSLRERGGYIDLRNMSQETRQTLRDHGITDEDLSTIAGQDHVIRGESEFNALFSRVDDLDQNGSSRSIASTDRSGSLTRAGAVYEALRAEVDTNRARIAREGGARFAGDSTLDSVMDGRSVLRQGAQGEHVRKVQQALIDLGFDIPTNGASGTYDRETALAVERFQRETGLTVDGAVGQETLGTLAATAPPPGQQLERSAEYDRLYEDGRVDIAIAIGADEHGTVPENTRQLLSGLRAQGYSRLDVGSLSPERRAELGLTDERYDPNAQYFHRQFTDPESGQEVDAVVRLITPGADGSQARASFEQALRQDEVVFYGGHARYGTGPDFDHINSGDGNFVIDPHGNRRAHHPPSGLRESIRGRSSDLGSLDQRPDYQVLCFNACSTEEYLHNLRDPSTFGRDHDSTDIITTTIPTRLATIDQHALRFLQGVTSRESNNSMLGDMSRSEQTFLRRHGMDDLTGRAGHTFTESGFLTNPNTRRVRSSTP